MTRDIESGYVEKLKHFAQNSLSMPRNRQIQLDVVRCLAILLAMGWHFNNVTVGIPPLDWLIAPGRQMGWVGVDLFFVLSGFLIGGLIFSEYKTSSNFEASRFLFRRIFKIWPVMYLLLILQLLINRHPWEEYFFQCFFHVQNYYHTSLNHLWSLAVEEHFYLLFAGSFSVMMRFRGHAGGMPYLLVVVMICALIARIIGVRLGVDPIDLQTQTQYRIDGLAFGVLLAWTKVFNPELFETIRSKKFWLYLIIATDCLLLANVKHASATMQSFGYTLNYIGSGALILSILNCNWMNNSRFAFFMAWIGFFSYPMYVFQFTALKPAEALVSRLHLTGALGASAYLVIVYAGAILAAVIVSVFLERPMLALRDRLVPPARTKAE